MKIIQITVRHPDWVTCRNWFSGRGFCGAINLIDIDVPVRCHRCGRAL